MGAWGTGISADDTFKDIYDDFFEQFNNEIAVSQIRPALEKTYSSMLSDEAEANLFYFAVAKAQWECGNLDKDIFSKVKGIVESGAEINRWRSLGASASDLKKREKAVLAFLDQLRKINPKPRKPKKKRFRDSIFEIGDCLSIDLKNGNYGAALVLMSEKQTEFGINLVLLVDYYSEKKPTIREIEKGNCLMDKFENRPARPFAMYCYAMMFKKVTFQFEKIGHTKVTRLYDIRKDFQTFGPWDTLAHRVIRPNTIGPKISGIIKVSKLAKKSLFF